MNKGNSSGDSIPKFFRVYVPEISGEDLELPMFFNRFFSKSFPENVTVRSLYGKRWRMGLRKCTGDTEIFVLVNGWKKIARDENLKCREFLFFEFDGFNVFNFCIYDRSMTKRLGSSTTQTDEIKVESESDGEEGRASDDIISISDDDDYVTTGNEDDDNDDDIQDESDSDKDNANDDIISSNDDDDVATNNEDHDDYVATNNEDDDDAGNYAANDDDQDRNEDDERTRKRKGASRDGKDYRDCLDDRMNPFFTVNQKLKIRHGVRVPAKVIKGYDLKFHESIDIVDPLVKRFGKIKRKVDIEKNGSVFLKGFESIRRRNLVKSSDKMICELRTKKNGLVHEIKVHIVHV